jgi:hypothetical protein
VHDEAMTPLASRINTFHGGWLAILTKYGAYYLEPAEYRQQLARRLWRYGVFLAKALARRKFSDEGFRKHHRATVALALRSLGRRSAAPPPRDDRSGTPVS